MHQPDKKVYLIGNISVHIWSVFCLAFCFNFCPIKVKS
jgi:hypothetical protein